MACNPMNLMRALSVWSYLGSVVGLIAASAPLVAYSITPSSPSTNQAVWVRHAASINGRIEGSLQQLTGESSILNGGAVITGDLWVPGTPNIRSNGSPQYSGTIESSGSTQPSNYQVTLNGNCRLRHVVRRVDPVGLPAVQPPEPPAGTRSVTIHKPGQSPGDFTTIKDLTLNGNVGLMNVPPGAYGRFTANGGSGFVRGCRMRLRRPFIIFRA